MIRFQVQTSGAIKNSMRNFWHATPRDVCLSAGLGDGPLPVEQGEE